MKAPKSKKRLMMWVVLRVSPVGGLPTEATYPVFRTRQMAERYSAWMQNVYAHCRATWRVVTLAQALAILGAEPCDTERQKGWWYYKQRYMLSGALVPYHPYTFIERRKRVSDYAIGVEVAV